MIGEKRITKTINILCPVGSDKKTVSFPVDFFQNTPFFASLGLRILLWIFWWSPFLFSLKTVCSLGPEATERYMKWWETSRFYFIREAFNSLRVLAFLAKLGDEWGSNG